MMIRTWRMRHIRRRVLLLLLALGMVMTASACTSSPGSTGESSSSSAPAGAPQSGRSVASANGVSGKPSTYGAPADDTASASIPPAVTTPVPAPGGGDVSQTVSTVDMTTQAPVALDKPGDFGRGVTIVLTGVKKITTEARLPGEIAGPGLALAFTINNDSDAAIDLSSVVVDVSDAAGRPAIGMTAAPAAPFNGDLAARQQAGAVYVVTLPTGSTDPVSISVTYSSQAPVVVFTGAAS